MSNEKTVVLAPTVNMPTESEQTVSIPVLSDYAFTEQFKIYYENLKQNVSTTAVLSSNAIHTDLKLATSQLNATFEKQWQDIHITIINKIITSCIDRLKMLINSNTPIAGLPKPEGFLKEGIVYNPKMIDLPKKYDESRSAVYNFEKLQLDLVNTVFTLENLLLEMHSKPGPDPLTDFIEAVKEKDKNEHDAIRLCKHLKAAYIDIRTMLTDEKQEFVRNYEDLEDKIRIFKMRIEDERELQHAEKKYIDKWQNARLEQNTMIQEGREHAYNFEIEDSGYRSGLENTIHSTIAYYLLESQADLQKEIEHWMVKYDDDLDYKENQITHMRVELDKMLERVEKVEIDYNKRVEDMDNWLEYKRQAKLAKILRRVENRAAFKIQRWWREVMIRKQLGPYAKKKKKGGKGGKGGKGKKK